MRRLCSICKRTTREWVMVNGKPICLDCYGHSHRTGA